MITKYVFFAVVATVLNLLAQKTSFMIYDAQYSLFIAMSLGTAVGLVVKFILDKRYIFISKNDSVKGNMRDFSMYSITGLFTTLLFWVVEFSFDYLFIYDSAKYIGAVVGLSMGYILKYQLDKKYVFRSQI